MRLPPVTVWLLRQVVVMIPIGLACWLIIFTPAIWSSWTYRRPHGPCPAQLPRQASLCCCEWWCRRNYCHFRYYAHYVTTHPCPNVAIPQNKSSITFSTPVTVLSAALSWLLLQRTLLLWPSNSVENRMLNFPQSRCSVLIICIPLFSPAVVTSTADVSLTAHRLLWGKFYNNGQVCRVI